MTERSNQRQAALVDQQEAIRDYLDALLQDIPAFDDEPAAPTATQAVEPEKRPAPEELPTVAAVPQEPEQEEVAEPLPEQPVAEQEPEADEPIERDALQALFFDVGGLKLAVPLTELHSVVPWGDVDVTPMPRQPEWQLGLMRYRESNVRVVDTVNLVLPPEKRQNQEAQAEPKHILVVGDGSWGITCHGIGDVVRLGADEVKWRRRGSARPWLAGTVIGHLSAVIDTGAFARMLQDRGG